MFSVLAEYVFDASSMTGMLRWKITSLYSHGEWDLMMKLKHAKMSYLI
jgi:hypothetical protein